MDAINEVKEFRRWQFTCNTTIGRLRLPTTHLRGNHARLR
jgi:hypothetical protein